jgi:NAD(P)-dependent dehydrogenase (short-subunit alcohol dehydrogenase family)
VPTTKIALITGANRGIGFETCRQLAQRDLHVILTSRDPAKGQAAAETLRGEGHQLSYHQLDVTNLDQVATIREFVEHEFGRLDVLVNNAGVYLDEGVSVFDVSLDTMHATLETNFYGPLHLCRAFIPLMRQHNYGRVVNVSSGYGSLSRMYGREAAYRISKAALNALTRIVADEVRGHDIKVNAVDPGWVQSGMGGSAAPRSLAKGADTIVWLATLPDTGPSGCFFRDRQPTPW